MTNAFELRTSLKVAASTAQEFGATGRQIDMIVALARGANDFNILSGGRLTKGDASRIIDDMIAHGAEPDWTKSEEELDAEDNAAASVERTIAYKTATKAQKKANKARIEQEAMKAAQGGRRVRHPKFGEGSVVSEAKFPMPNGDFIVTIAFDGQKKPTKVAKNVIQFL